MLQYGCTLKNVILGVKKPNPKDHVLMIHPYRGVQNRQLHRDSVLVAARAWGARNGVWSLMGGVSVRVTEMFWVSDGGRSHPAVRVPNATEPLTLKWVILVLLCESHFSKKKGGPTHPTSS